MSSQYNVRISYNWSSTTKAPINGTFQCYRKGDLGEDGGATIVARAEGFRSETSTTDTGTYEILATSTTPSKTWEGEYTQSIHLADGAYASTSSGKERADLTFGEAEKVVSLGFWPVLDTTAWQTHMTNSTTKSVKFYQRMLDGTEKQVAQVNFLKSTAVPVV